VPIVFTFTVSVLIVFTLATFIILVSKGIFYSPLSNVFYTLTTLLRLSILIRLFALSILIKLLALSILIRLLLLSILIKLSTVSNLTVFCKGFILIY